MVERISEIYGEVKRIVLTVESDGLENVFAGEFRVGHGRAQ